MRSASTRFFAKVDKSADCWDWVAALSPSGYGTFNPLSGAGAVFAHRWSFEHHLGPIPDGLNVLHRCDNPRCVNPAHLFLGDQAANVEDCRSKGRLGYESRGGHSSYVGVWFDRRRRRWVSHLCHRRRTITIGRFETEIEAAAARDRYVREHSLPHALNLS